MSQGTHAEDAVPAHYRRLQPLAWDGFAFQLPPRWEVTGYDLADAKRGALQLHAGTRFCGELSWRPIEGAPDAPLIIADALDRVAPEDKGAGGRARPTTATVGEWQLGWRAEDGERVALLWQAARARVLMWVFGRHAGEHGMREIAAVLGSFDPNSGGRRRWRLFGVGCALPPGFALDRLEAHPAASALQMSNGQLVRVTHRRFGMVAATLARAGGMKAFYASLLNGSGYRLLDLASSEVDGSEELAVRFEYAGMRGLDKLMGAWIPGSGRLWHARDEDRLYAWEVSGPKGRDVAGLDHAWE